MTEQQVLDHGLVRLVDSMGGDLAVVRAARVSYAADWRAGESEGSDARLIRYLMRNRHTSPFEAVQVTFEVKAPIFIARQWMRHRTASYNEVSARYTALPEEFYIPDEDVIGLQSKDNKQAREIVANGAAETFRQVLRDHCERSFDLYRVALDQGIPRELARSLLPLNTYTHFFVSLNLHNLFHFLRLRLHEHAQYEIREYAKAMLEMVRAIAPVSVGAFCEYEMAGV